LASLTKCGVLAFAQEEARSASQSLSPSNEPGSESTALSTQSIATVAEPLDRPVVAEGGLAQAISDRGCRDAVSVNSLGSVDDVLRSQRLISVRQDCDDEFQDPTWP